MKHPADYDFLSAEVQKCPFPFYSALRAEAPVYREPKTGFYIVSRYDTVVAVIQDIARFSNDVALASKVGNCPEAEAILADGYPRPQTLQRTDPPRHNRYRRFLNRAFTAARARDMAPTMERIVEGLLDELAADIEARQPVEIVSRLAIPLPCRVIASQIGVRAQDWAYIRRWNDALLDPVGMMIDDARRIECARATLEFQNYFVDRIAERKADPAQDFGADLLGDLVREMTDPDTPLSLPEVLNLMEQVLTGGNETTTSTLASGLLILARNPDEQTRLRAAPAGIKDFIEEVLRTESPAQGLFRRATETVELEGVTIPKDSIVVIRFGAANRDETKFADAEAFDPVRVDPVQHIAFGTGVHLCPGRFLARQELLSAFTLILRRFERIELAPGADDLEYHPSSFLRGLKSLRLVLTPAPLH